MQLPDPHDRLLATERETAKLLIQNPELFARAWDGLTAADFTHPAYAAVFAAVEKAAAELGGANGGQRIPSGCTGSPRPARAEEIRSLVASLAVEPLPVQGEVTMRFVVAQLRRAAAADGDAGDRRS